MVTEQVFLLSGILAVKALGPRESVISQNLGLVGNDFSKPRKAACFI